MDFPSSIKYLWKSHWNVSFAIYLKQNWYFHVQGFHNYAFRRNMIKMETLKIIIMLIFDIRTLKIIKIWKSNFKVPKKCMSGLPYLQKGWWKVFWNSLFSYLQNPKLIMPQTVFIVTNFRLVSPPCTMCTPTWGAYFELDPYNTQTKIPALPPNVAYCISVLGYKELKNIIF